ncbi:SLC13 family permease [Actinobacillus porcinus]|uniref:SLC13 family permease n=1 Tax=Actinobacillus porcinus TaxID=51048 RepID=UPI0023571EA7|nr:SLC13 family permease [Actinobacillus porcinus]MCI5764987.1 SLC13 family permease [Actinobacillus porcinus]MDY5421408.1 SLC13 family permease [Actinobacillus porcinus]MDY6216184.1 SLC13 family permease [Actinobacillus porcinus]
MNDAILSYLPSPLVITVSLLCAAIFLFVQNKVRMDVIALLVMLVFCLTGILSVQEVFAGFSDPNVILIALLFIVGEGLVRTGVAYQVSEWLMKAAKNSETKVLILLMLAVAGLGAFMSSTGVVAIFIPVVLVICQQMKISPKRLMMPLSVAGLISGMMTLIATAPNLVVNAELVRVHAGRFSFFSFTPIGLLVLALGIVYMLVVRRWLSSTDEGTTETVDRHSIEDLIETYHLHERVKRFVVKSGSSFIGKPVEELHLRSNYGLNILAIERWKRFRPVFLAASLGKTEIKEKDILVIDIANPELDLNDLCRLLHLEQAEIRSQNFNEQAKSIGMAEITPIPDASAIGKSAVELRFRSRYGVNIIGVKRNGELLQGNLVEEPFQLGDLLLVVGDWKLIQQLREKTKSFFILNYPSEIDKAVPARSQAWHAIFSIVTMVVLMVTGIVPNVIAALIACLMLGKFRCVDAKSAYGSVHWATLILIIGMMPFSIALQKTGGVNLVVDFMIHTVGTMGKHWMLISLFVLCAVVGLFISNTATAILMAPIAITMAQQLGLSPVPFAMTVAIASSAAFMTPISSPVNTMVLGPGNYQFSDFVKIGVPFTILVMLVTVFVVPLLFPF